MNEHEMEDLLWEYPERLLNEALKQFQRQPSSSVGRADLIFVDRIGRLLVVELKKGTLERSAIPQLFDYYGMVKSQFPQKSVELMVIANQIPMERRIACEQHNIEPREISQKKFRDVAAEVGYVFRSEGSGSALTSGLDQALDHTNTWIAAGLVPAGEFSSGPSKVERGWYFRRGREGREYFFACVNAKGSCSLRRFDSATGRFLGREYKSGDYQESFSEYVNGAVHLRLSRQPNLEKDCRSRLPATVLAELRRQVETEFP